MAAFALVAMLAAPAQAQNPGWTQAGMLNCRVNPRIGFIIAGHQSMECRFTQTGLQPRAYEGALNMVGLNIGISAGETCVSIPATVESWVTGRTRGPY